MRLWNKINFVLIICDHAGHFTLKCKIKARCTHCGRTHHSTLHAVIVKLRRSPSCKHLRQRSQRNCEWSCFCERCSRRERANRTDATRAYAERFTRYRMGQPPHVGGSPFQRALLDQGSTFSFISESLCQIMWTRRYRTDLYAVSTKKYTGIAKSKVSLRLSPCSKSAPIFPLTAYQRITSYAASQIRPIDSWSRRWEVVS